MLSLYKEYLEDAVAGAERGESKIDNGIIFMDGMSGTKTRHFYNRLLNHSDSRYLEIGTWKGSSVCSAMCGNAATVVCIDNWSEFGGPKGEFLGNFNRYKGDNAASFIEQDCFTVDVTRLPKFNIYMYDGNHTSDSHYRALEHFLPCLDETFIFIVDDWNWDYVRAGTNKAITDLQLQVLYEHEIRHTSDNSHTPRDFAKANWWNGIYMAVLAKNPSL
mgnify:CR=1 FL=1